MSADSAQEKPVPAIFIIGGLRLVMSFDDSLRRYEWSNKARLPHDLRSDTNRASAKLIYLREIAS